VATDAEHRDQARANRTHAEWLLAQAVNDPVARQWAVTATFYSALHAASAYLVGRGVVVTNHDARNKALAHPGNGVPPAVYGAYRRLQRSSVQARYLMRSFTPAQVRALIVQELATVLTLAGI